MPFLMIFPIWFGAAQNASSTTPFDPADRESVATYLATLVPAGEAEVRKMIDAIDSDDFATRQKALSDLGRVAGTMRELLEKERDATESPEVRKGLARVLSRAKPKTGSALGDAAQAVIKHGYRGLSGELVASLATTVSAPEAQRIIAAARLSSDGSDHANLVLLLGSSSPSVRSGAAKVLAASGKAGDQIRPLLADQDPSVRLAAAEAFAELSDTACLPVFAELAVGEDFFLRWRASEALRQLTAGKISPDPTTPPEAIDIPAVDQLQPLGVPRPIDLLGEKGDFSAWKLARKNNYDVASAVRHEKGFLRIAGSGHCAWGSPLHFQNYRLRLEWRFPNGLGKGNAGLGLGKFEEPAPGHFNGWEKSEAPEIEIREGDTGSLFLKGAELEVGGRKMDGVVKKQHPPDESVGGWNSLEVEERDGKLRVWVNGILQNEATGCSPRVTCFGFRSEGHEIDLRNLTLEPLPGSRVEGAPRVPMPKSEEKPKAEAEIDDQ